jgi:hypothetical protein
VKSKLANKVLIPVVILIWGLLLFRLLNGEQQVAPAAALSGSGGGMGEGLAFDSFALLPDYRDPFLNQIPSRAASTTGQPAPRQQSQGQLVRVSAPARLPVTRYQGGVTGPDSAITGILLLNEKPYTIRQGDSLSGLYVRQLTLDRLTLSGADTTWVVYRSTP